MLVLTRVENETIVIDDRIKVTIVAVDGGKVRVGITAPRDVPVHRQEVWDRISPAPPLDGGAGRAP